MQFPIDFTNDATLRALFAWQTRIGVAPAFGSRPIGWYQIHQCHAYDVLREWAGRAVHEEQLLIRTSYGRIEAKPLSPRARWIDIGRPSDVYRVADERSRK